MPFDMFEDAYKLTLWRGLPLTHISASVSRLRDLLPEFELRPFGQAPNNNPRMRTIVRMPAPYDRYERPVAAVSDKYDLLQHQVLATWLAEDLAEAKLENLNADVAITEYGERMRITIPLSDYAVDLFKTRDVGDKYAPELVVTNSVDRSCALSVAIRWRRLVCRNGMFIVDEDRMRSVHHLSWSRMLEVRNFMSDRLQVAPGIANELDTWRNKPVQRAKAQEWVEERLRERAGWSVENCARVWAILETGYDGIVEKPRKQAIKHALSEYRVGQHCKVEGIEFPIQTAYDMAQILTWVTSRQRSVETESEATDEVPKLIRDLLGSQT